MMPGRGRVALRGNVHIDMLHCGQVRRVSIRPKYSYVMPKLNVSSSVLKKTDVGNGREPPQRVAYLEGHTFAGGRLTPE